MPDRPGQAFLRMLGIGARVGAISGRRKAQRERVAGAVGARAARIQTAEQKEAQKRQAAEGVIRGMVEPPRAIQIPQALPAPTKQTFGQYETEGIRQELAGIPKPYRGHQLAAARERFERRAYAGEEVPMGPAVVNVATGVMDPDYGYAPIEETPVQRRERRAGQYQEAQVEQQRAYEGRQTEIAQRQAEQEQERARVERDVAGLVAQHRGGVGLAAILGRREKAAREAAKPPPPSPEQKGVQAAQQQAAKEAEEDRIARGEPPTTVEPVQIAEDAQQGFLQMPPAEQLRAIETFRRNGQEANAKAFEALIAGQ